MSEDARSDVALARRLMREVGAAALATLDASGAPFASYVLSAPAANGEPLLLLSRLAVHTQNALRDSRASLLFVADRADRPDLTAARLTLLGALQADANPQARETYLARHPAAASYASFSDFAMYRFEVASGHLVAGFGRIRGLAAAELLGPQAREG